MPDWKPAWTSGRRFESSIWKLRATLAPAFQKRYMDCSIQRAWVASLAPTGFGGLLSHQNSVTQTGCLPGEVVPAFSAPRRTLTTRPRSGVEASYRLGPERSGPPPVLSIGWWAKTSKLTPPEQPAVRAYLVAAGFLPFFVFFFLVLTGLTQRTCCQNWTGRERAPLAG